MAHPRHILVFFGLIIPCFLFSQAPGPWNNPLMIAYGSDGIQFAAPQMFQDSAGVPSLARDNSGRLIAAFQWFPAPMYGPHWDSVAVKFSVDQGVTWSPPQPVVVNGLPPGFQRPFDPAIAITDAGGYRLYFSSGILPVAGADSTIDTYSAIGSDGIHYQFEPGARVNHPTKRMIDPAVLKFHGLWHYTAPVGAPQEGSYHYISGDGINFQVTPVIPSDPAHNWTGNLMTESDAEMRFYGSGPWIWYRVTPDGGLWYPPVNTNLHGGDPACIKLAPGSYLVIYTGLNPAQAIRGNDEPRRVSVVPNPAGNEVWIEAAGARELAVFSIDGQPMIRVEPPASRTSLGLTGLAPGVYILRITFPDRVETTRLMKN